MNKQKLIGLTMLTFGSIYMISLFLFIEKFEKMNDSLGLIMTIISTIFIIFGSGLLFIKTQEEHFKEQAIKNNEYNKLKKHYKYKPVVTYILIVINILVYLIVNISQGNSEIIKYAISKNDFQIYKLFTSIFTHSSESHIITNMLALYLCGSKLESLIGNIKYLLVYFISGFGSSLLIAIFANYPCVGASGAILGLYGCYLFIAFKNRNIMKYTYKYDLLPTIIIILIGTIIIPKISIIGHFGGLIIGIVYGVTFFNKKILKEE